MAAMTPTIASLQLATCSRSVDSGCTCVDECSKAGSAGAHLRNGACEPHGVCNAHLCTPASIRGQAGEVHAYAMLAESSSLQDRTCAKYVLQADMDCQQSAF